MTQLNAFQRNPDLVNIVDLNEYFNKRNVPNLQRPGLAIKSSFIQSSSYHQEDVIMHKDDQDERYLVQSTNPRDREVSSNFSPYFAGDRDERIGTQRGFVGRSYETRKYPSTRLQPVQGDFAQCLKKPYKAEVIRTDTQKRPPVPNDNNVYPVSSFTDGTSETIDDYLVDLTGQRSKTLQRRTKQVRDGSLHHEIDISAVIIGEPYVQRMSGVKTDKAKVLAPVLYCYGS